MVMSQLQQPIMDERLQYKVIMSNNKNEQFESSFAEHDLLLIPQDESTHLQISKSISQHLPANQLRTSRRPQTMNARTLFLQRPLYLLNEVLNEPCEQMECRGQPGKLKLKISNRNNLSPEQYFNRSHFKCIYDKMSNYRKQNKSYTGKLKSVDTLIDYNWKMFKQLQMQINIQDECEQDQFDSDFQSGNLCRVYAKLIEPKEYYLLMENDVNTHGYNNWFFYRFKNKEKGVTRFNIINFVKKTSFFNQGMLISIYSLRKRNYEGVKWFKGGDRVTFSDVNFIRNHHFSENYCCLSFQYNFQYENDEVYFAMNQPYTYTRLINFIEQMKSNAVDRQVQSKGIGYTLADNIIPMVKINRSLNVKEKSVILVLGRQHPCQTVGSFVVEAMMNCLTRLKEVSIEFLLKKYEFIFIPMVNPDGVIHGCSRCNMAGLDLNRQWGDEAMKELTPETIKIKAFITNLSKSRKIKYLIDLHGHGKKLNSFFFACKGDEKEHYRLLSMAMSKLQPRFNIYGCTYGITKQKENTIRSKMYGMGAHSYTLQNSLYGWKDDATIKHYNEVDYFSIGKSILQALFTLEADQDLVYKELGINRSMLAAELVTLNDRIEKEDIINCENKEILSESDPEGDRLNIEEILGNCKSISIKKRIKETYTSKSIDNVKAKKKNKKASKAESSSKLEQKSLRDSCPSYLKRQATDNPAMYVEYLKSSLRNTDVKSNKKTSFSEKWKQKRKSIMEKKRNQSRMIEIQQNISLLKTNFHKGNNIKPKFHQKRADPITLKNTLTQAFGKSKIYHSKVKTEFKQSQLECANIAKKDTVAIQFKKVEKQIKIQQLKEDSLAMLLTDTLSILKLSKRQQKQPKQQPQKKRSCSILKNQKSEKIHAKTEQKCDDQIFNTSKYKKFKQFMARGNNSKKFAKIQNSVFYYFPIL